MKPPTVLTIAGSDSGGGAGIQADLRAFARCGVHGACAITGVTAQNTTSVDHIEVMAPAVVGAQLHAVVADFDVRAVKVGMLGSRAVVEAVAEVLRSELAGAPVVLDPVLAASTGSGLLGPGGAEALVAELLPLATVVTPNLEEARALLRAAGRLADSGDAAALARDLVALGSAAAVITGSNGATATATDPGSPQNAAGVVVDTFSDGRSVVEITGTRLPGSGGHGSGCTHSAVLAAALALGHDPLEAARVAHQLTADAIAHRLEGVGAGVAPVAVLHAGARIAALPVTPVASEAERDR